jgi:hypothetical protein
MGNLFGLVLHLFYIGFSDGIFVWLFLGDVFGVRIEKNVLEFVEQKIGMCVPRKEDAYYGFCKKMHLVFFDVKDYTYLVLYSSITY